MLYKYYWSKPQYHLQDDMIAWCRANIGDGAWYAHINYEDDMLVKHSWGCWWFLGQGQFVFRTLENYDKFTDFWQHYGNNRN